MGASSLSGLGLPGAGDKVKSEPGVEPIINPSGTRGPIDLSAAAVAAQQHQNQIIKHQEPKEQQPM